MNFYKKIIVSPKIRQRILAWFRFIPDEQMVKLQYRIKCGRKLNLSNPQRYSEKIQWYKLNYRNDLMPVCADKFAVREYVKSRGMEHLLNELYAVYDTPEEIRWEELPESFIMKATHGSGKNKVVTDKSQTSLEELQSTAREWLRNPGYSAGREWGYTDIKPKIIFEKLLPRDERNDLPDYKFFCFDGKVYCLYVMIDYTDNRDNGKVGFFDRSFRQLPCRRVEYHALTEQIEKPKNFEQMIQYAETLAQGFPHVRMDFYNIDGRTVFGEMTFYHASGYTLFEPDEFDFEMGKQFVLPAKKQ